MGRMSGKRMSMESVQLNKLTIQPIRHLNLKKEDVWLDLKYLLYITSLCADICSAKRLASWRTSFGRVDISASCRPTDSMVQI